MLKNILMPGMRVCIVPYSHTFNVYVDTKEFYDIYDYEDPSSDYNAISRAYRDYGIEDIRIIFPNDTELMIQNKILNSDILFFTGGDPVAMMKRLKSIKHIIDKFDGIVMGASAGAMIQTKEFVIDGEGYPYSYYKGLGMIQLDVDLLVHFKPNKEMFNIFKRSVKERPNVLLLTIRDGECLIF
jgi:cyanophycinase-like exopeptidase